MTEQQFPEPSVDPWSIERLLRGEPADADPAAQAIAALVAAARTDAAEAELAAESAALAAYAEAVSSGIAAGHRLRRSSMLSLSSLLAGKIAAAAAVGAVSLGGVTAAAYTDNLPSSLQDFAHDTVGAPAPHHRDAQTPKGPQLAGNSAFGLCTAYQAAQASGASPTNSVAFQNLIRAAGGADNVAAYCAAVQHPGKSSSHPSGKPSAHPSGPPTAHPSGKPSSNPGAAHASAHPAGPPASPGAGHRP